VSDLTAPENRLERGRGKLLEVYRPIWTPAGKPVLFETYAPYDEVPSQMGQIWRGFAGVTLTSLMLLVLLLIPILWRVLNQLKRSQAQREALLPSAAPLVRESLSAREVQVLRLVEQGLANKQIGRALGITERTVKVHVGHVFRRLGVTDRASAAMWARDNLGADEPV
jgi:DNA-binding CsgD family transcriptional regulator